LTQPVGPEKKSSFNYTTYILEANDNFIKWPGSRTVAIPYDLQEEELMKLLPQINGVLFTGGALTLIDPVTHEQHQYYKLAKKIFNYSKYMKDVKNETWPVLGIC
jgi:gamma-glutamyl-gamma-aminobutyrate hydrolase PuuD